MYMYYFSFLLQIRLTMTGMLNLFEDVCNTRVITGNSSSHDFILSERSAFRIKLGF